MAQLLTVAHNCGHEVTYTLTSPSPAPPRRRIPVPAMCPPCEAEAGMLHCSLYHRSHPPHDCVIYPSSLAAGKNCQAIPA